MVPQVGIVQHRTARAQCEQRSPDGRLGWPVSPSFFRGPKRDTFLLLVPSCLGLFGWGLVRGMGDFSFLGTFSAFASLSHFSLFVNGISRRCVHWDKSGWSGYHRNSWSRAPMWAVSKARRSRVFSLKPIPSGILVLFWLELTWARRNGRCEVLEASSGSSCQ